MSIFTALARRLFPQRTRLTPTGELRFSLANGRELDRDFSVIPSETSLAERKYLYFLAKELTVTGNLLELGPFLGGTTRAMARGIEHSCVPGRKLITVDQFDNYYDVTTFRKFGVTGSGEDGEMVKFRQIFDELHSKESYFEFIDAHTVKIADLPDESTDYSFLSSVQDLRAVFIDGCKSWYSVKDFVGNVLPKTDVGTYYLFQDYGRYTCFWIPAFVESFPEHFEFLGAVDATFVFRLVRPLDYAQVSRVFADQPVDMNVDDVDALFERVFLRERDENHAAAMTTTRIQAAAFHAYIGDKEKATSLLRDLLRQDFVRGHLEKRVREALQSPTYTPHGQVRL